MENMRGNCSFEARRENYMNKSFFFCSLFISILHFPNFFEIHKIRRFEAEMWWNDELYRIKWKKYYNKNFVNQFETSPFILYDPIKTCH